MSKGKVWTANYKAVYDGERKLLGDVLEPKVKDSWFYLDKEETKSWEYQKGAKNEERVVKSSGFKLGDTRDVYTWISENYDVKMKSRDKFKRGILSMLYGANEYTISKVMQTEIKTVRKIPIN